MDKNRKRGNCSSNFNLRVIDGGLEKKSKSLPNCKKCKNNMAKNNYQSLIFDIDYDCKKTTERYEQEINRITEKAICYFKNISALNVSNTIKTKVEYVLKNRKKEKRMKTWLRVRRKTNEKTLETVVLDLLTFDICGEYNQGKFTDVDSKILSKCKNSGIKNFNEMKLQKQIENKINSKESQKNNCVLCVSFNSDGEKFKSKVNFMW
ncbi:MAG: hypothetical protein LBI55_04330 [Oscillospiraceae bacterium]|jgi:hypothetical protein|nr:hypothetical protein [Oscillospiraceae bacterium]